MNRLHSRGGATYTTVTVSVHGETIRPLLLQHSTSNTPVESPTASVFFSCVKALSTSLCQCKLLSRGDISSSSLLSFQFWGGHTSPGLQNPEMPLRSSRLPSPEGCGTLYDISLYSQQANNNRCARRKRRGTNGGAIVSVCHVCVSPFVCLVRSRVGEQASPVLTGNARRSFTPRQTNHSWLR